MTGVLDACPVCRTGLEGEPATCPSCGNDLTVYRNIIRRSIELIAAAREALARGDATLAREVVQRLPQLDSDLGADFYALATRLALHEDRVDDARRLAGRAGPESAALLPAASADAHLLRTAREEYNYALTAARQGRLDVARRHLERAVELAPDEARLHSLKLRVDLKRGDWGACYADLAALDRLGARPSRYVGLEQLLPPLSSAA